jgi:hypothetical protein
VYMGTERLFDKLRGIKICPPPKKNLFGMFFLYQFGTTLFTVQKCCIMNSIIISVVTFV